MTATVNKKIILTPEANPSRTAVLVMVFRCLVMFGITNVDDNVGTGSGSDRVLPDDENKPSRYRSGF